MKLATAAAWVILPILAGTGIYLLKMKVESEEERLSALETKIADAREAIHVLHAEWSYLNDPSRLRELADRYLSLKPIRPNQVVTIDRIPIAIPPSAPAAPPVASNAPAPAAPKAAGGPDANDQIAAAIAALAVERMPARRPKP